MHRSEADASSRTLALQMTVIKQNNKIRSRQMKEIRRIDRGTGKKGGEGRKGGNRTRRRSRSGVSAPRSAKGDMIKLENIKLGEKGAEQTGRSAKGKGQEELDRERT